MKRSFSWGHININVSDLERSIAFYEKLGFELFLPGIPYLALHKEPPSPLPKDAAAALGVPPGVVGRACIMQLDGGFPKIDLTEFAGLESRSALANQDLGLVRLCLVSRDLQQDYAALVELGVEFISHPKVCHERLADVAVCRDPDGTLIELLQVHLERWPPLPS